MFYVVKILGIQFAYIISRGQKVKGFPHFTELALLTNSLCRQVVFAFWETWYILNNINTFGHRRHQRNGDVFLLTASPYLLQQGQVLFKWPAQYALCRSVQYSNIGSWGQIWKLKMESFGIFKLTNVQLQIGGQTWFDGWVTHFSDHPPKHHCTPYFKTEEIWIFQQYLMTALPRFFRTNWLILYRKSSLICQQNSDASSTGCTYMVYR